MCRLNFFHRTPSCLLSQSLRCLPCSFLIAYFLPVTIIPSSQESTGCFAGSDCLHNTTSYIWLFHLGSSDVVGTMESDDVTIAEVANMTIGKTASTKEDVLLRNFYPPPTII